MSVTNFPCYDYIIGLYNGDCNCLTGRPADYNDSDSGLYISDLLEPKVLDGLLNCDQGASVWDLMEDARDLAIRYLIAESNALLLKTNKLKRKPFYGGVGASTYTRDLALVNGTYAGVRMITPPIRSGYLKIKKIGLLLNNTQALTVTVYDRNGTLLQTLNLNATANVHTINTITPITLPLYNEYLDYNDYYFMYQVNGFEPKNNGIYGCASCSKNHYSWMDWEYSNKHPWHAWINVGGFTSPTIPDFMNDTTSGTDLMNGMTFEVELGCLVNEVFCKDALDYGGNTLAQAMAIAIQKLAGALFVDKILLSPNLNRMQMINHEQLSASAVEWRATYAEMINYVTENIDIEANDCFECRDIIEMIKGGIFA